MGRGDFSDAERDLVGPLLPPERALVGRGYRAITGSSSMECFTCCGAAVLCATCMSDKISGTRSVCAFVSGPCRVSGMACKHWVDLGQTDDWQHMIDSTSFRGYVSAVGGKGGACATLAVDHAAALRSKSTPAATTKVCLSGSS